jgi:hypothetical protein
LRHPCALAEHADMCSHCAGIALPCVLLCSEISDVLSARHQRARPSRLPPHPATTCAHRTPAAPRSTKRWVMRQLERPRYLGRRVRMPASWEMHLSSTDERACSLYTSVALTNVPALTGYDAAGAHQGRAKSALRAAEQGQDRSSQGCQGARKVEQEG